MLEIKGSQSHPGKPPTRQNFGQRLKGIGIVLAIVAAIIVIAAIYALYTSQHAGEVSNTKYINLSGSSSK